jgi:hypothetical protein
VGGRLLLTDNRGRGGERVSVLVRGARGFNAAESIGGGAEAAEIALRLTLIEECEMRQGHSGA